MKTVDHSGASDNLAWNPRLAHLRGTAALLVLAFHVFHTFYGNWKPFPGATGFGWLVEGQTGVSLFFVLSGFLFMSIALRAGGVIDYASFLRNRVLRIVPLFVLVFFVAISIGRDAFRPQDALYLVFSNLGDAPTSKQFMTGAAWTISVEFTFYLVFPFLARFALAQGPVYLFRLIGLLFLMKVGAYLVSDRPTHMIYSTLLGRLDQFLIGMLAAQLAEKFKLRAVHGVWVAASVLAMWALLELQMRRASFFLPQPRQAFWLVWPTLEALGWAAVISTYVSWRAALWDWAAAWLERAGEISYSLYLWHSLIIFLVSRLLGSRDLTGSPPVNAMLAGGVVLGLSWWVAGLSYQTIELPFMKLRRRYTG